MKEQLFSPEEVIIKLKKLIKIIEKIQEETYNNGITFAQARIIFPIVRDNRGYTIQELAEIGGVTKGLVSRVISDLEKIDFVRRDKISKEQDRNYKIILGEKGNELISKKRVQMQKVSDKWRDKIKHEDLKNFEKVLNILTDTQGEK